ncbi:MAG: hypothetical protein ABSC48_05470 [Terracidiphilus sp.]|jgi:hypothetical protein
MAAAAFAVSSCRQQKAAADNQPASNRLATATEVFDLRSKCAALGEKIMSENIIGSALTHDQVSRYNPETNHCYVKLEVSTADLSTPREKFITHEYLYDGQTKELLATAIREGNRESAEIFSESLKRFVHDPILPSYDETVSLMDKFVAEDRGP